MQHALSIDVEEWYHAELIRSRLQGPRPASRVVRATEAILELLERHGVRGTFFCVGEVLAEHPELARRISRGGHEIGCHGMTHRPLGELGPDGFEAELVAFAQLCREILGPERQVVGFRAPTFTLERDNDWALPLLVRHGYTYDSSVFPMRGPLYGIPGAPLAPYPVDLRDPARIDPESPLIEVPPAVVQISGMRFPVAGGVYLRGLPSGLFVRLLRRIERERPFVLYVHPWEADPETPRAKLPLVARLATYHGAGSVLPKLDRLLRTFRFTTVAEVAGGQRC